MSEFSSIARYAGTVLVGQLAIMAFGVTDTIVAGHYSDEALAALSIGSAIYVSVYVGLMGVLQALLPILAEQHGARQWQRMGQSVRQALYLCAIAAVLGMALLLSPGPILNWASVPQALRADVTSYLDVIAMALPAALLFRMYSTLNQALARPQLVTWLQVASLLLKVPLSIWFTFGGAGLPAQGAVGCAWATLLVSMVMLVVSGWLLRSQDVYRPLALWQKMEKPDWPELARFARLGVPAGLAIMVEVTSFTLMALLIARLGSVPTASHQIAANLGAVLYMMPLSIAIATSARVSYWRGAGHEVLARNTAWMGFRVAALMGLALAALLFIAKVPIAHLYTQNAAVIALTVQLLAWVSIYHMADALQTICVFLLRCYRITVGPLLLYCLLLWAGGLGGGYWLAYHGGFGLAAQQSPIAFWMASAAALAVTALCFIGLLYRTLNQPFDSDTSQPSH